MQDKFCYRIICLVITHIFFSAAMVLASSSLGDLKIPDQFGNIKEVYQAMDAQPNSERTIIQIQDAHCNYEAQKNLAAILEYLIQEKKLRLIMVEGGSDDVNLSFLRSFADKNVRERVANKYLRQGKISGEEYLDIVSDYDIELYGVEDKKLYGENLNAFRESEPYRQKGLADLHDFATVISALKPHIYGAELLAFEEKKNAFKEKTISLAQYSQYLEEIAQRQRIKMEAFPSLQSFGVSVKLEQRLDLEQSESQRNSFLSALAQIINEKEGNALVKITQDFKNGAVKPEAYYVFLRDMARGRIDIGQEYPYFYAYIEYINSSRNVKAADLLQELKQLNLMISESLIATSEERRLHEIEQAIAILEGVLNLDLTPEDYAFLKSHRNNFVTASWINFLADNCRKFKIDGQPTASSAIDDNIDRLEAFYRLSTARETAFVNNLVDKMEASRDKLAVLITGGFHTPAISRMLQDEGYSYLVVTPKVTRKSDAGVYFSLLKGQGSPAEDDIDMYEWTEEEDYISE